jgi:predicted dehydrogenase
LSIRIGIAGFGKIGKIRHDILAKRKDCQIVGIFEKNIDHQSNSSCNYFKSIDELLNNVDAVVISTFNDSLAEFTIKAINKNIHVFCEKPPARTVDELKGVQNALNKKNILY